MITDLLPHAPQDPKDIYIVGSKVEYICTNGYYLIGPKTIECIAGETWSNRPGLCTGECLYDNQDWTFTSQWNSEFVNFSASLKVQAWVPRWRCHSLSITADL